MTVPSDAVPSDAVPSDAAPSTSVPSTSTPSRTVDGERDDLQPTAAEARAVLAALDPAAHYRSVAELARSDDGSILGTMPYSAEIGYHSPTCVVVEPNPAGRDDIALFGRAAYREFDEVLVAAFADASIEHLLDHLYHLLILENRNVAVVTNHGQIIDIALVMAALVMALSDPKRSYGVLGEHSTLEEISDRTNVLVSRMVTSRQAFGIPAIEVIQHMCRTFLSIPQTNSRRRSRLTPEVVRANNVLMRDELFARLDGGGQMLAMAASGSQDLRLAANLVQRVRTTWRQRRGEDPGPAPSLHLQPLYRGTISLMLASHDVLPMAISLESAHPACVIGGITRVRTTEDCHQVMEWIAAAHEASTGVNTVYHRHEDPLLEQVRSVLRS